MVKKLKIPAICSHVAVRLSNCIFVFGGDFRDEKKGPLSLSTIWMYNLYTEQWKKHVIPDRNLAPPPSRNSCAVAVGSDIYMFGGFLFREQQSTNSLWKLTITTTGCFIRSQIRVKNQERTPSPRSSHSGWEYAGKVWTFGGYGPSPEGYLNEHGDFQHCQHLQGRNNQLLCFDPSRQEWTDIKTSGAIPEPQARHATTVTNDKVWLYSGINGDLYQLNMMSLVWTKNQTGQVKPRPRILCSLNAATESKLVLHGGLGSKSGPWVFDVPSSTWNLQRLNRDHHRYNHKGTEGLNGYVVVIGGLSSESHKYKSYRIIRVKWEPKSLQQLSIKIIYDHRDALSWRWLPKRLVTQIMCPGIEDVGTYYVEPHGQ